MMYQHYTMDFELGGEHPLQQSELISEILNFCLYGSSTIIYMDL